MIVCSNLYVFMLPIPTCSLVHMSCQLSDVKQCSLRCDWYCFLPETTLFLLYNIVHNKDVKCNHFNRYLS